VHAALRILDDRINAEAPPVAPPRPPARKTAKDVAKLVARELLPPVAARLLRRLMHSDPQ